MVSDNSSEIKFIRIIHARSLNPGNKMAHSLYDSFVRFLAFYYRIILHFFVKCVLCGIIYPHLSEKCGAEGNEEKA
jgi:hypothetical protein